MQSYSKGSWGLSVYPRVDCIITNTSTSLSLRRRQCGHRYAIRAGRNLPDKEFRYLRTVIVKAAVYRGFDQELAPHHLTLRHRRSEEHTSELQPILRSSYAVFCLQKTYIHKYNVYTKRH